MCPFCRQIQSFCFNPGGTSHSLCPTLGGEVYRVSVWIRREVHTGFWWGNLRERDHLKDLGVDGRIILKKFLKNMTGTWIGLIWFTLRTGGVLL